MKVPRDKDGKFVGVIIRVLIERVASVIMVKIKTRLQMTLPRRVSARGCVRQSTASGLHLASLRVALASSPKLLGITRTTQGLNNLELSPLFCLLQLSEAKGGQRVLPPARSLFPSASGGLRALGCVRERRLSVRRCRLGTTCSRFWFPSAARLRRRRLCGIRSSPVRPRLVGALLRRRQRACGGGSSFVGDLCRS